MKDWKIVEKNGVMVRQYLVFCPMDEAPYGLADVAALSAHYDAARRRRKYGL